VASIRAIAAQRADVIKRGEAVDAWLAGEFGVEIPPPIERVAQPELAEVMELERQVAIRERIREAFEAKAPAGGVDPTTLDGTIADVKEYLASVSDTRALDMLLAAETNGKSRKGVLSAIEARQAELEAEAEEGDEE
jgi:phage-related baseplate assembly protein